MRVCRTPFRISIFAFRPELAGMFQCFSRSVKGFANLGNPLRLHRMLEAAKTPILPSSIPHLPLLSFTSRMAQAPTKNFKHYVIDAAVWLFTHISAGGRGAQVESPSYPGALYHVALVWIAHRLNLVTRTRPTHLPLITLSQIGMTPVPALLFYLPC
jgi:hypothetical protein